MKTIWRSWVRISIVVARGESVEPPANEQTNFPRRRKAEVEMPDSDEDGFTYGCSIVDDGNLNSKYDHAFNFNGPDLQDGRCLTIAREINGRTDSQWYGWRSSEHHQRNARKETTREQGHLADSEYQSK
ncbi:hypothetical protein BD410DRAFT_803754 [Rickenella mellea]|uniref:Uncharacterized protein n=1 Tax=Rickenella mellea TaxID=50990 RepID=A0A4Y7Q4N0_9AGAM|nr:hypothetical protein BD410DRAFT_803754 [Rickenella mellea]